MVYAWLPTPPVAASLLMRSADDIFHPLLPPYEWYLRRRTLERLSASLKTRKDAATYRGSLTVPDDGIPDDGNDGVVTSGSLRLALYGGMVGLTVGFVLCGDRWPALLP